MPRYIDADVMMSDTLQEYENSNQYRNAIIRMINKAPTIDAVEVVRCKDCKDIFFDDWYKCFSCANPYGLNEEVKPDDFCSHGERKDERSRR